MFFKCNFQWIFAIFNLCGTPWSFTRKVVLRNNFRRRPRREPVRRWRDGVAMAATLDLEASEDWVKAAEAAEILPELSPVNEKNEKNCPLSSIAVFDIK